MLFRNGGKMKEAVLVYPLSIDLSASKSVPRQALFIPANSSGYVVGNLPDPDERKNRDKYEF